METEEKMISQEKGWSQRRSGKGGRRRHVEGKEEK